MFGYNNIKQIAKGFYNNITNKENALSEKRMDICRQCPLFSVNNILGAICDDQKYINPDTNEVSYIRKPNYVAGCGCKLSAKTRVPEATCIINKW